MAYILRYLCEVTYTRPQSTGGGERSTFNELRLLNFKERSGPNNGLIVEWDQQTTSKIQLVGIIWIQSSPVGGRNVTPRRECNTPQCADIVHHGVQCRSQECETSFPPFHFIFVHCCQNLGRKEKVIIESLRREWRTVVYFLVLNFQYFEKLRSAASAAKCGCVDLFLNGYLKVTFES